MQQFIFCEGIRTEVHYFEMLIHTLPLAVQPLWQVQGVGYNTLSLLQRAEQWLAERNKKMLPPCMIWLVFDKDEYPDDHFNRTILACARNPQLTAIWSNEAFELWFLLHLGFYDAQTSRFQYKKMLEYAMQKAGAKGYRYEKENGESIRQIIRTGSEKMATKRAIDLCERYAHEPRFAKRNPCTQVHILVKAIRNSAHSFLLQQSATT